MKLIYHFDKNGTRTTPYSVPNNATVHFADDGLTIDELRRVVAELRAELKEKEERYISETKIEKSRQLKINLALSLLSAVVGWPLSNAF